MSSYQAIARARGVVIVLIACVLTDCMLALALRRPWAVAQFSAEQGVVFAHDFAGGVVSPGVSYRVAGQLRNAVPLVATVCVCACRWRVACTL